MDPVGQRARRRVVALPAVATAIAAAASERPEPPDLSGTGIGDAWDEFLEDSVAPLTTLATFVAGAWIVLFVLARLLVYLPILRDPLTTKETSGRARMDRCLLIGIAPIAGAAMALWVGYRQANSAAQRRSSNERTHD